MNIDKVLTSELASRGVPRLVMTTDKMKTVYLDNGERVDPLNGILWKWVPFAANNTQVALGTLPAECAVLSMKMFVTEAFNAATTNYLAIGIAADPDLFGNETGNGSGSIATGWYDFTTGEAGYTTTARDLVVTYTQSGTAATTGNALVVLRYQRFPQSNTAL